ncbi:MAG: methyltransferase domain-containing protein [Acidobacteria bacterium]|nr:methyltransferase domain-containing protein [Acidobacteriota bacterium]
MTKQTSLGIFCVAFLGFLGIGLADAFAFQLGQRPADDYIQLMDRPTRVAGLKVDEVIEKLKLKPGDIVADVGSGSGAFSIPMARAIAPNGTLYAVDIDQGMLDFVSERAKKDGLSNVRAVLGEYDDPKLPVKDVDVAFFHRVLHMIEHRQAYLNSVAKYLKPDGRIVIIEKEPEDSDDWMWLKRSDVDTWMAAISFYPAEKFGLYDDRYFVVYQRPYGNSVLLKKREPAPAPEKKD